MSMNKEVKMFFTELIRYPLHETIYAEPGETRTVEARLVERMMKRGAKIVDEDFKEAEEKAKLAAADEAKKNPNKDVVITTPDLQPNVAPMDLPKKEVKKEEKSEVDEGADILGSDVKKEEKKEVKKEVKKEEKKEVKKH